MREESVTVRAAALVAAFVREALAVGVGVGAAAGSFYLLQAVSGVPLG